MLILQYKLTTDLGAIIIVESFISSARANCAPQFASQFVSWMPTIAGVRSERVNNTCPTFYFVLLLLFNALQ